jgi:O-antigen ligase
MPVYLKELIVVVTIGALIFRFAKPVVLQFSAEIDFVRRRNAWFVLTVTAFLSPSFWLYALIAIPLLTLIARKDSNPSALYLLLLHVIPPIEIPVPMVGMPYIFFVNNYLLLSFCVLTPVALRLLRSNDEVQTRGLEAMDFCLLAYGILSAVLFTRAQESGGGLYPVSFTDNLRHAFVFFFATVVPYYSISRANSSRRALVDTFATFCLSCALLAAIAIFESARRWLLFEDMPSRWGYGIGISFYLTRAGSLRAMASTGHPLALGHLLMIAFGFWLYLQCKLKSKLRRLAGVVLLWAGLLAAYSRGPWIAAALVYFVFSAFRPRPFSKLLKAATIGGIVAVVVSLSPLRDKVISVLPAFGGTVDDYSILYRQRLAVRSWEIIRESPFFGDQTALLQMQELRQGQGIIDIVNTYLQVLLNSGFVGLSLFLSFILLALFKAWALTRRITPFDPDLGMLGASLVACILGTLLLLAGGSFGTGTERMFYVLAALATAYAHLGRSAPHRQFGQTCNNGDAQLPR